MVTPSYKKISNQHILYDPQITSEANPSFFDPRAFQHQNAPLKASGGRGSAFFVSDDRHHYLLRHYMRGGMMNKWIKDHYLWLGLAQTRAWREWHLLDKMYQKGLPVPRPVAARAIQKGWRYSADLLTLVLPDCRSLADDLKKGMLADKTLEATGKSIRRFHNLGIDHADLNAHNILINQKGMVYLIDFDQGRHRPGSEHWKKGNLNRLLRSLSKLQRENSTGDFPFVKWKILLQSYHAFPREAR